MLEDGCNLYTHIFCVNNMLYMNVLVNYVNMLLDSHIGELNVQINSSSDPHACRLKTNLKCSIFVIQLQMLHISLGLIKLLFYLKLMITLHVRRL